MKTLIATLAAAALPAAAADVIHVYTTPHTTYYFTDPPTYYYTEPARVTYIEPLPATEQIVVTAPRDTDAAIADDVAYVIASDRRISGKIGVETFRGDVTLTGRVVTPGQAERAARDARSVDGVREVQNLLSPRVGR